MNLLWDNVLQKTGQILTTLAYNTWIKPIRFIDLHSDILTIEVPNDYHRNELNDRYMSLFKEIIAGLIDAPIDIEIRIAEQTIAALPQSDQPEQLSFKPDQPKADINRGDWTLSKLYAKYTFESFVCGSGNEFAHAASLAVSENPADKYNPLFIYGGTGLGKTHLMIAIGNQIIQNNPDSKICYYTSETFMNEMVNCIRHRKMEDFRMKLRKADVLLIDDIQFMANKEATQEEFFHTFNALYESHRQIVLTSDKFPKEIPGLEDRLRSRFEWGLIADIQPPNTETKIAILKKKAEINKIELPDDVALLIGSSNASNIRELEGMLVRIGAYASLTKNRISLALAKDILKDIIVEKNKDITIELIQKTVADHFKIKISDLKSEKRLRAFVMPRQIAIYLCRELTKASFPEIGDKFGGRDHSTVIHAVKKMNNLFEQDAEILAAYESLKKKLLA